MSSLAPSGLQGAPLKSYSADRLAVRRAVLSQHVSISFPFTVEEVVRMGAAEMARDALKRELSGEDPVMLMDFPASSSGTGEGSELDVRIATQQKLLDGLMRKLQPFVVCTKWAAETFALWIAHTYAFRLREAAVGLTAPIVSVPPVTLPAC